MKNIDLRKDTVKIVGVYYSYNSYKKKFVNEKNFKNHLQKIETVFTVWKIRNLTLEWKITIFRTLAVSKIIHLASVTVLANYAVTQLNKIQKEFIWNHKRPKIKVKTLINIFDKGGLKLDFPSKITRLQCSWVKRLLDRNVHEWNIILLFY